MRSKTLKKTIADTNDQLKKTNENWTTANGQQQIKPFN